MSFRLKRKESVEAGVKRILLEQIDKAEEELGEKDGGIHEAIHQSRKRCKKIRGIYRLIRPLAPKAYRVENARFRDIAQELSRARDAEAMIESYDALMERFADEIESRGAFSDIRRRLTRRRNALAESESDIEAKAERFIAELEQAREALSSWTLDQDGFDAVADGFLKTYQRGRQAMDAALKEPTDGNFHEWRKRAKYHRFHLRALNRLWPAVIACLEAEADALGQALGDDHDLAVLSEFLLAERAEYGKRADLDRFLGLLETRRQELKNAARCIGGRLYAAKPKALRHQFEKYWKTWRSKGRALVA